MELNEFSFLSLLLITGLAAFVPLLTTQLRKLRLPIVVGEIMAGMIVGQSGLDLIEPSPVLEFLTIFGFTYLMFISGLEVDFSIITTYSTSEKDSDLQWWKNPINLGLLVFVLTLFISFLISEVFYMWDLIQDPFMIALILSTTSLGIVVPVLKERQLITKHFGQNILIAALVADMGTLILITVEVAILKRGLTLDVLLILLLLVAFAVVARLGMWAAKIPGLSRLIEELSHATAQIRVRGAVALMVAFIVLAEWLGIEVILGAFLAGAVISLLSHHEGSFLYLKMDAIGFGFFIPIFFIMVGVQFDLPALFNSPEAMLLVPLLLGVAYLIKLVAVLPYRLLFSWRETFSAGFLLSARLSLIIAAAAIALDLEIITEAVDSAIILVAIVTCTLSPILFNRILPAKTSEKKRRGIILVGLGEMPTLLTERLLNLGEDVIMIGRDRGRRRQKRQKELPLLEGDPTLPETLEQGGAATANTLIAMSTFDEVNLIACRLARKKFGIPNLIAQANDPKLANEMVKLGVRVVQPQLATVMALEGALQFPAAFDLIANHTDPEVKIREVELNNPSLNNRFLRHIRLPGSTLILGVRRNGEVIVPHGNTKLHQGDLIMLVGHPESLLRAISILDPY